MPIKTVALVPKTDLGNGGEGGPIWFEVGGVDAAQLLDEGNATHDGNTTYIEATAGDQIMVLGFEVPPDLKTSTSITVRVIVNRSVGSDRIALLLNRGVIGENAVAVTESLETAGSYGEATYTDFRYNPFSNPTAFSISKGDPLLLVFTPTVISGIIRVTAVELSLSYDSSTVWATEPKATGSWTASGAGTGTWIPMEHPSGSWEKT